MIVKLAVRSYARGPDGSPIHGNVGSDLHPSFDADPPDLGYFKGRFLFLRFITETIGSQDGSRMNGYILFENYVGIKDHLRFDTAILSYSGTSSHVYLSYQHRPFLHHRIFLHHALRPNPSLGMNYRPGIHPGGRMDSFPGRRGDLKSFEKRYQGFAGILHEDGVKPRREKILPGKKHGIFMGEEILRRCPERYHRLRIVLFRSSYTTNPPGSVSHNPSLKLLRKFFDGYRHFLHTHGILLISSLLL